MMELQRQDFDDAGHVAAIFEQWMKQAPVLAAVFQKVSSNAKVKKAVDTARGSLARTEVIVAAILTEDPQKMPDLVSGFRGIPVSGPWARIFTAAQAHSLATVATASEQEKYQSQSRPCKL